MRKILLLLALLFVLPAQAQTPLGYNNACTAALVSTCQLKTTGGQLWFFQATTTVASWVFIVDTTTTPSNGAIQPVIHYNVGVGTSTLVADQSPIIFQNGIYVACSSTAPPTLTLAVTCIFTGATK